MMSKNIYVGNLSFETTNTDLETAFAQFGQVRRAQVAMDRTTGRSRGFGFVEMSQGADEAIAEMNGVQMNGRTIVVNEARPREARPAISNYGGSRRY
jgi:RNA recognition motif-containing protein